MSRTVRLGFRLSRAIGLCVLCVLIDWIGLNISQSLTGPTGSSAFIVISQWDAAIAFVITLAVGFAIQLREPNRFDEWLLASVPFLWLARYGTPVVPGTDAFLWGYLYDVAIVAALGVSILIVRVRSARPRARSEGR